LLIIELVKQNNYKIEQNKFKLENLKKHINIKSKIRLKNQEIPSLNHVKKSGDNEIGLIMKQIGETQITAYNRLEKLENFQKTVKDEIRNYITAEVGKQLKK